MLFKIRLSAVVLLVVVCSIFTQPVFAYWSIISGVVSNGYKAIEYIKKNLPGDENKVLEKVSVQDNHECTIVTQKLKGKNIWVNYHVDDGTPYDIVYNAANNGHTYGKMIQTLTDKMTSEGKGNWQFAIAGINARKVTQKFGCGDGRTYWYGQQAEYDYHVAVSKNGYCWKNFGDLERQSKKVKEEVNAYNAERNPC